MANTVVSGKGAPAHIGGSLSDGIFFQNLGTNPIFVGYGDQTGAAVSSAACDGVIQPGGSYSVGAKRDVWLYADVDTPIVYNYDATASADGGTNVTASVSGSVAVNNKPQVTVPDGVAINGPVNINGNVGVSGNVGIVGSVGIAGNVNVAGSVNAFGQNIWTTLYSAGAGIAAGASYVNVMNNADVSTLQALLIQLDGGGGLNASICGATLIWLDQNGATLFAEECLGYAFGNTTWITAVKGPRVSINIFIDYAIYGNYPFNCGCRILGSTIDVPEFYYTNPGVSQGGANTNSWQSFTGPTQAVLTGGLQDFYWRNTTATGQSMDYLLPSFNRTFNGATQYDGLNASGSTQAVFIVKAAVKGKAVSAWPSIYAKLFTGQTSISQYQYYTANAPRAPIGIYTFGIYAQLLATMSYERYGT